MIVLGERHTFDEREIERLVQQFDSIDTVAYDNIPANKVITHIDALVSSKTKSTIILNTAARIPDDLLRHLTNLEQRGITYITIENFLEKYLQKCYIPKDQTSADFLEKIQPLRLNQRAIKALIDYPSALILGFIYVVWYPIIYFLTNRQSPGSIHFVQDRVGLNNREFSCIKFRSMHLDAEKDGIKFASEDDDRIFPWGETMRKYRIDEIPQFLNVLQGRMSLIGPRPERRFWIEQFEQEIPYYNTRHLVKPGITGWAQVMYPYGANAEDARQKLMYDLYYIKHWSPWLEVKTIWKTVMVVLGKKGL